MKFGRETSFGLRQGLPSTRTVALWVLLLSGCSHSLKGKPKPLAPYPVATETVVTESHFGVHLQDPYRWMETNTAAFLSWVRAEAHYSQSILGAIPLRTALRQRLSELSAESVRVSEIRERGGRLFFLRRLPNGEADALWVKAGADAREELLLDPNRNKAERQNLAYFEPSPDGRRIAYGLAHNGSEEGSLEILDVETRRTLPGRGPALRNTNITWLSNSELIYTDGVAKNGGTRQGPAAFLHRLGEDFTSDVPIFDQRSAGAPLGDEVDISLLTDESSNYLVASVNSGVLDPRRIFVKRRDALRASETPWTLAATADEGIDSAVLRKDALYIMSHRDASRRAVSRVDLGDRGFVNRRVLIPESKTVLQGILVSKESIFTLEMDSGLVQMRRFDDQGRELPMPALPVRGESDTAIPRTDSDGAYIRIESVISPPAWLRFDGAKNAWEAVPLVETFPSARVPMTLRRMVATSLDGTAVPIDVYSRADLKFDGNNPTLLNVYGSYGIPYQPGYLPFRIPWLEQGGVLAYAHVRGGGEFGSAWHHAGQKENKQRSVEDFLACAHSLVKYGVTSPNHLGAQGQSAGTIVASMGVLQEPGLFGAAILASGTYNMLRSEFSNHEGIANIAEFGTVTKEEEFRGLYRMDALQHVRGDVSYPPMLFHVGLNDPRVSPWDSGKFVALLQARAKVRGPILLRADLHGGHGTGMNVGSDVEKYSDYYSFAFAYLGNESQRAFR